MQLLRLIGSLGFIPGLGSLAAGQEDRFIALQTNVPGESTYVRRTEIEALTDVSPSHCVLLLSSGTLFSPRKDVRAFEKCSSVLEQLHGSTYTSFPADFGNIYVSSQGIVTLAWTSNCRCRISLRSGKFVYAKQSCDEVHKTLPRE